jgi:hypothetical protein
MFLLLACSSSPPTSTLDVIDTSTSKEDIIDEDIIDEENTDEQNPYFESWSDTGSTHISKISVNYEGLLIEDQAVITFETSPAGLEESNSLYLTLVNHTQDEITLEQNDWLMGEGFESTTQFPATLLENESLVVEILFQAQGFTESQIHTGYFSPTSDVQIELQAIVPSPLRLILGSRQGNLWASDDYGTTFFDLTSLPVGQIKNLTFGNEHFIVAYADQLTENSNGGVLYSEDGITWNEAVVDDITAFQDCAFGLGRFLCLRGDTISWSTDGVTWQHEETQHDFDLLDIMFSKDRFVAVGRNGRRVVSWDGVSWNLENFSGQVDPYLAVAEQILPNANGEWDRRWIAVGGEHRFFASMSEDGGTSWTNIPFSTCQGDQLQSLIFFEDSQTMLAQGASTCHHNMIQSANGLLWNPLIQTHPFDQYQILGQWQGTTYLFHPLEDGGKLYTSTDGQNFLEHFTFPIGEHIQFLAFSTWSGE